VDGASNVKGSVAGIILEGPDNVTLEKALKLDFKTSNNQAEYKALITLQKLSNEVGDKKLKCYIDSHLVQGQVANRYQAKEAILLRY